MAYDNTLPAGGRANFVSQTVAELEGVEIAFLSVDFAADVSSETTHPDASANTAALQLAKEAIQNQGVNILGEGALAASNTAKVFMVRADSLDTISSTTTAAAIQTAIQGLNALTPDKVTANISSAVVATKDLSDTSAGVS